MLRVRQSQTQTQTRRRRWRVAIDDGSAAFVLRATMFAPIDSCSIARCRRRRRLRCRQRCSASVAAHSANVNWTVRKKRYTQFAPHFCIIIIWFDFMTATLRFLPSPTFSFSPPAMFAYHTNFMINLQKRGNFHGEGGHCLILASCVTCGISSFIRRVPRRRFT